jgi:isoleucyl-tRNA synthetase
MIKIAAPIVPHIAEEVHELMATRNAECQGSSQSQSVFMDHWQPSVSKKRN